MRGSGNIPASVNYESLARGYDRHRSGEGPYLAPLVRHASAASAARVFELGAGTGNVSASFHRRYPCALVCMDRSAAMIAAARSKHAPGRWIRADAGRLPARDASCDFLFSVFMLHHIDNLRGLFRECARVTRRAAAFVTTTHEIIARHPMNTYFPSFSMIDQTRFQPLETVTEAMQDAGFMHLDVETVSAPPVPCDARYVEKVANRFISTFELIPEDEFAEGLSRLRTDVAARGELERPVVWECVCVTGQARG